MTLVFYNAKSLRKKRKTSERRGHMSTNCNDPKNKVANLEKWRR